MSLTTVLTPETEAELVSVVAMLEAREVPCFVHSGALGSLLPGVQVELVNTRAIMVPEEREAEALALIADMQGSTGTHDDYSKYPRSSKLRSLVELLLFGWFVPGHRGSKRRSDGDT